MTIVAISGGSCSGKSWLARELAASLGNKAGVLSLDDFYKDGSRLPLDERNRQNFDLPESIDWELFEVVLTAIANGGSPDLPRYDFATHTRRAETSSWKCCEVVLVEGLWTISRPNLRHLYRLKLYLDCPTSLRLERRLLRDSASRARSKPAITAQFNGQVEPMHQKYVSPQSAMADWVIQSPVSDSDLKRCVEFCENQAGRR